MPCRLVELSSLLYNILPEPQQVRYRSIRQDVIVSHKDCEDANKAYDLYCLEMRKRDDFPRVLLYQDRPAADQEARRLYELRDVQLQRLKAEYHTAHQELHQTRAVFAAYKKALKVVFEPELVID